VLLTDEGNNEFFKRVLQKQYQRSLLTLERSCVRPPLSPLSSCTRR